MGLKSNDSCLDKVKEDEPIFVLRAQDKFAPLLVSIWITLVADATNGMAHDKRLEAIELVHKMKDWQRQNGCKIPD